MEPRIQYVKTTDGVSIAYWTMGAGRPLVIGPPLSFSHIGLEASLFGVGEWYEHLARQRTILRWDARNYGLSSRMVSEPTEDVWDSDLDAVIARLGWISFDAIAFGSAGTRMIAYAARRPEAVEKLVLINVMVRTADYYPEGLGQTVASLLERDWKLFRETAAQAVTGWSQGNLAHEYARFMAASISHEDAVRIFPLEGSIDVSIFLPQLRAQTLAVVPERSPLRGGYLRSAQQIAANAPNASMVELPNAGFAPRLMSIDHSRRAIESFLGVEDDEPGSPLTDASSGTAVILFADIVDSTALTEQLGDSAFRTKARDLDTALRTIIREHAGAAIDGKLVGDGVLATFASAAKAIEAALACARAGDDAGLPLHLGIHAGDVIRESDPDGRSNVFGGAVNIASRISALSAPGDVLVSDTVRSLARTSAGVSFEDRGEESLKGVGEPVRVWAVRERE